MGLFKNAVVGDKGAVKAHKDAKENLADVAGKTKVETPEFLAANDKVGETAKNVPWHRR